MPDFWNVNPDTSFSFTPDTSVKTQGYYDTVRANNPTMYETIKFQDPRYIAEQRASANTSAADASAAAAAAAAAQNTIPSYSGPTAEAKLQGLLPAGFEDTLLPSSVASPFISSTSASGRAKAQDFIQNMLRRGTINDTGRADALSKLTAQDPGVTSKLTGISDVLLANERAKLRGIANEGYGAAAGQSGETFDPSPYKGRVDTEAASFLQGFPQSFAGGVGDVGALYDTAGLSAAGGAATGSRSNAFDPYAVAGGKLTTGLEGEAVPTQKKRSTAVF